MRRPRPVSADHERRQIVVALSAERRPGVCDHSGQLAGGGDRHVDNSVPAQFDDDPTGKGTGAGITAVGALIIRVVGPLPRYRDAPVE